MLGSIINNIDGNTTTRINIGRNNENNNPTIKSSKLNSPKSITMSTTNSNKNRITRGELDIILGASVRRVILEQQEVTNQFNFLDILTTKKMYKAIGVEYEADGVIKTVKLRKPNTIIDDFRSIIITAGALMTPKILMNSGIGPIDVLKAADTTVYIDSPQVGKNLHDHPVIALTVRINHQKLPCNFIYFICYIIFFFLFIYFFFFYILIIKYIL